MKLTLGFSPCPNDTFIFDAMVNKKIDTGGLELDVVLEDVETLNEWALEGKLDITKLSFPAFFQSLHKYILLNSGSALGKGVGPVLVTNNDQGIKYDEVKNHQIVLPGINTTANLLFSFSFPEAKNKIFIRFDKIEDFIISGSEASSFGGYRQGENEVLGKARPLGVIIHENRFTYQQKGLYKVADLGEIWEEKMKVPIPLGGIAIKRGIDQSTAMHADSLIRKSLEYAFRNYPAVAEYVKQYSQTMSEEVMRKHIDLYVNGYSLNLGIEGRHAILKLREIYNSIHLPVGNNHLSSDIFLS